MAVEIAPVEARAIRSDLPSDFRQLAGP